MRIDLVEEFVSERAACPFGHKEFHRVVIEQAVPLLREQGVDVVAFGPSGDDPEMYYLVRAYASIEELRALEPRSP